MPKARTLALGSFLLVAVAATAVGLWVALGDRAADPQTASPDVAPVPRADVGDAPASLEGHADARPLKTASLDALLAKLRSDEDDSSDEDALHEIRSRGLEDPSLIDRLLAQLDDAERRGGALRALAALGAAAARPLAAWGLAQEGAWRFTALDLLRRMGPEAAPATGLLVDRLAGEDDRWTRKQLFAVLAAIGPGARHAAPVMVRWLTPPLDDALVRDAAVVLAAVAGDDPATLDVFRAALLDEETLARPGVLEALANLGLRGAPLVPLVIDLLEDPEEATRRQAATALGAIGGGHEGVIEALVAMVEHDGPMGQRAAGRALATLGPAGSRALVRLAQKAKDVDVRLGTVAILMQAERHDPACAEVLVGVLQEDCDKGWKQRALVFLARVDPPPRPDVVLPAVLHALEDPTLAENACRALANVPGDGARAALREALVREDAPKVGTAALDALLRAMAEDPGRDPLLADLLKPNVPAALVRSTLSRLARLGPKGRQAILLPALEPWLAHEDPALRALAYQVLPRLDGDAGVLVDRLLAGLDDPACAWVCTTTLRAFPQHAHRTVPALVEALLVLPADAPSRQGVGWVVVYLARTWRGAKAWIEARRETATEAGCAVLDELLAKIR